MDHSVDSAEETASAQQPPQCIAPYITETGGTILQQLLEFRTHLLEAVEELHIRKDAELNFEDQISKLVLEKQEVEWQKESLQHKNETALKQHSESLSNVKKQFQDRIRNIEEEKGKYQVSAELKDKEIYSLKEELRSLHLLKYNLEKKSKELEQKVTLQSRLKDSHLHQLGEVEKRFGALSKQCTMVKQAHEKLEQNVDEALRINKNLTFANEKQQAAIVSLKKELDTMNNKLIKVKMISIRHDKTNSRGDKEPHVEKLLQKLSMESEMVKKLERENVAVRAEKQEIMKSLQHNQQLLLSQIQTVNKVELELETHQEQYQALKQKHEVMRDKSKAMEDKVAQLMESYAATTSNWDKERKTFLDRMKSEDQELRAVRKAYDELQQKHSHVSSMAKEQAQHILDLEMRSISLSHHSVSTQIDLPSSVLTTNPDVLQDTGAVTGLDAAVATTEQDNPHQLSHPPSPELFVCPVVASSDVSQCGADSVTSIVNDKILNFGIVSDSTLFDYNLVSGDTSVSNPDHMFSKSPVLLLSTKENKGDKKGNSGMEDGKHGCRDDESREKREERNPEQQQLQGEDSKEASAAYKQVTGRSDRRRGDSQRSAEEWRGSRKPESETRDKDERAETDRAEGREETAVQTLETQRASQTTAEEKYTQQVIDFVGSQKPVSVCELPLCQQSLCREAKDQDTDSSRIHGSSVDPEPDPVNHLCQDAPEFEKIQTADETPVDKSIETCVHSFADINGVQELKIIEAPKYPSVSEPQTFPQCQETSDQVRVQLTFWEDDSTAKNKCESKMDTQENQGVNQEEPLTQDIGTHTNMDTNDSESLTVKYQEKMTSDTHEDTRDKKITKGETDQKTFMPSTGPGSSSDQGSELSEVGSVGRFQHPPSRVSVLPKHNRVSSVISRVSDLLNASCVSGNAASLTRQPQAEWNALGETTAADVVNSAPKRNGGPVSATSFPVSSSLSAVSGLSSMTMSGSNRTASSAAQSPAPDSNIDLSFSQDRDEQQVSFRAQIYRIEQFLSNERLHLPKRRRLDNDKTNSQ